MGTVKRSELWSSLSNLSPHGYYVFPLVDKPGIKQPARGYYVVSLVDKPYIHKILIF